MGESQQLGFEKKLGADVVENNDSDNKKCGDKYEHEWQQLTQFLNVFERKLCWNI